MNDIVYIQQTKIEFFRLLDDENSKVLIERNEPLDFS
mgnify:CR=1 FL=1